MKSIIFIAPPAAGKGMQSALLKEKYHIPHISTGDLLREEIKSGSDLGKQVEDVMSKGNLVSDDIITTLLEKRLRQEDCNNGYILDGYPRNLEQAKEYEAILSRLNKDLGYVIFLDIDKDTATKRALGRLSCSLCGKGYNKYFDVLRPKKEGICDTCGSILESRTDDNEETFNTRIDTYFKKTQPLLDYYESKKVLHKVKITPELEPNDVLAQIEAIIA